MNVTTPVASRPRLNPRALPPATTARFALLVATAIATAAYLYAWLIEQLDVVSDAPRQCVAVAQAVTGSTTPQALVTWYGECARWASLRQAGLVGLMLLGFAGLTIGIYLAMPRRLRRGLTLLSMYQTVAGGRELVDFVKGTGRDMGHPEVTFYVDSSRGASHAFGRLGRYEVALNLETVESWLADDRDPSLATELRHELAHISNRDIDLTYLAIAVWRAFVIAVALPYAVVAVNAPQRLADLSVRLAVLLLLIWLVRLAVLRTREYYADAVAVGTPADEAAVRAYLQRPSRASRWEPLSTHPTRGHRVRALDSGEPMFRLSVWVSAATGGLVGLAFTPTSYLLDLLLPAQQSWRVWISGVLFGVLVAGVLTGAVWRVALARVLDGQQRYSTVAAATAFTAALLLGQVAMPRLPDASTWGDVAMSSPAHAGILALVLVGMVQAYLRWTMHSAAVWLPVVRHPRRAYYFGVAQSAVVFGLWLGVWFQMVELLRLGGSFLMFILVAVWAVLNPPLVLSLVWACAYPVIGWRSKGLDADHRPDWWRPGESVLGRRLPEDRPPLVAVYLVAVAVVVLYTVFVLPEYPAIASLVDIINTELPPPAIAYLELLRLLLVPVLYAALSTGVAVGLLLGGRRSTARAVTCAGLGALPSAIALMLTVLVHLTTAGPGLRDPVTLLKGLSGIGELAPKDRPEHPALGLMMLALVVGLLVLLAAGAAAGSLVRAVLPSPPRRRPARSAGRVAPWLAPLLAGALALGYFGWTNWSVADDTHIADSIDAGAVEPIIARARPGTVSPLASCSAIVQTLGDGIVLSSGEPASGLGDYLATVAAFALSSTDRTLQALGEAIVDSLRGDQIKLAANGAAVTVRYCVSSLGA